MPWIIEHETERDRKGWPLVWNNLIGWAARHMADVFSDDDKNKLFLPIGGRWKEVITERRPHGF